MITRASRAAGGSPRRRGPLLAVWVLAACVLATALALLSAPAAPAGEAPTSTTTPSSTTTTPSSTTTTPSSTPAPKPPPPKPLYRIVACRSFGSAPYFAGPPRREVAVGFDDGPWYDTPQFVTMLARAHVKATFFMIGEQISGSDRSLLLRELREGDVLGDHTWTHPDLAAVSNVREELARTIERIRSLTGYTPCVFRPPYGDYDSSVLATARSLGLATVLWDVDPSDYTLPGVAAIEQRVLEQVRPGSIIISHDGGGPRQQTLAAYPHIFAALKARGYRIVTIPQLLGFRPIYERCTRTCDGLGLPREKLPAGAIVWGPRR